jgi:methylmalonyl-CoA/ethylmalonyl-CoA epimerase
LAFSLWYATLPRWKEAGVLTDVDHIGFAVRDIDQAVAFYGATFGVTDWELIPIPKRHTIAAVAWVGGQMLELLAPTSPAAPFAKYLDARGPGMHHVAYRVDDVAAALAVLAARGVQLIDSAPYPGIHNTLVAFLHPRSCLGVLVELVQHRSGPGGG